MTIEKRQPTLESREAQRPPIDVSIESRASAKHPDRNEDAALGDLNRISREEQQPPVLHTADKAADLELVRRTGETEKQLAGALQERGVCGTFDGVSGARDLGQGLLASRLASGKIAEIMSHMPLDADARRATRSIEAAFRSANQAIAEYKKKRPDLQEMNTTGDVVKVVDNGDGTFDVAYGHAGDSRIYVLDGDTGQIRCETTDDGLAKYMLKAGKIDQEGYRQIMSAPSADALPDNLKWLFQKRNVITNGIGMGENFSVETGIIKAKKGDRILISSDGIHDNLTDEEIAEVMRAGGGVAELVAAAGRVADSGSGRAKKDDMTGTLIELRAEKPEAKLGEGSEAAAGATAEQLGQWSREVEHAAGQITQLEHLARAAQRYETARLSGHALPDINIHEINMIDKLGGRGGVERRLRDWKLYSLERRKILLENEVGQEALAEMDRAQQELRWNEMLSAAAAVEIAKRRRPGPELPTIYGADPASLAEVSRRVKAGEDPEVLKAIYDDNVSETSKKIASLETSIPHAGELRSTTEELKSLERQKQNEKDVADQQREQAARSALRAPAVGKPDQSGREEAEPAAPAKPKKGGLRGLFGSLLGK